MKFKVLLVILLLTSSYCYSQNFKRLRFGIGLGKSESLRSTIFYLEPSIYINRDFHLGFRLENFNETGVRSCFSISINSKYYFLTQKDNRLTSKFQPFIGFGLGAFFGTREDTYRKFITTPSGGLSEIVESGDSFKALGGFYPRLGLDFKRFTMVLEYNLIYRKQINQFCFDPIAGALPLNSFYRSDNYASIKVGYVFGGGKKKIM
ncbi:MAG: hypothetical protein ACKVOQ_10085 [Cyclobacteriaceae bacterium]